MPLRQRLLRYLFSTVLTALLVGGAWVWLALHWSYADGVQAGRLHELTRRGWICKTWEGMLVLQPAADNATRYFHFTVRDDGVAQRLQQLTGRGVRLHYREYRLMPSDCFGETDFVVVAAEEPPLPANLPALSTPLPAALSAPNGASLQPPPLPATLDAPAPAPSGGGAQAQPAGATPPSAGEPPTPMPAAAEPAAPSPPGSPNPEPR